MRMGLNTFDIDAEMYQNQKEQHSESKRQNQRIFFSCMLSYIVQNQKYQKLKK